MVRLTVTLVALFRHDQAIRSNWVSPEGDLDRSAVVLLRTAGIVYIDADTALVLAVVICTSQPT